VVNKMKWFTKDVNTMGVVNEQKEWLTKKEV
jgi:hypothetical protein